MSTKLPAGNCLSLTRILAMREEAHAEIRHHAHEIISLSSGITDVDVALTLSLAERNIDEQAALVTAARRLAALLADGSNGDA